MNESPEWTLKKKTKLVEWQHGSNFPCQMMINQTLDVGLLRACMRSTSYHHLARQRKKKFKKYFPSSTNATRFLNPIRVVQEITRTARVKLCVLLYLKRHSISFLWKKNKINKCCLLLWNLLQSLRFLEIPPPFYTRKVMQDLRPPECHWMFGWGIIDYRFWRGWWGYYKHLP